MNSFGFCARFLGSCVFVFSSVGDGGGREFRFGVYLYVFVFFCSI